MVKTECPFVRLCILGQLTCFIVHQLASKFYKTENGVQRCPRDGKGDDYNKNHLDNLQSSIRSGCKYLILHYRNGEDSEAALLPRFSYLHLAPIKDIVLAVYYHLTR